MVKNKNTAKSVRKPTRRKPRIRTSTKAKTEKLAPDVAAATRAKEKPWQFKKGAPSANPKGRPTGSRSEVLLALDKIGHANAEEILKNSVARAIAGNPDDCKLILSRAWPASKGRGYKLPLPKILKASDLPIAMAVVTEKLAEGEISPEEAQAIGAYLETHRKAIELANIEERLARLEQAAATTTPVDD